MAWADDDYGEFEDFDEPHDTIEAFADVDVASYAAWLNAIPIVEWPAMADDTWYGWGDRFRLLADSLMEYFSGCAVSGLGLFLLQPGQIHPPHRDVQPADWITRVHVPIITNPLATVEADGRVFHMEAGKAYRYDTRQLHAAVNGGTMPRVHFVFDVKRV